MYKFRLCITMIACTSLMASVASGQMFSSKSPQTTSNSTTTPTPLPPPLTPMSPSDFKKQVGTMNQQTQNNLSQQVLQKLTKHPANSSTPPTTKSTAPSTAPTEEKSSAKTPSSSGISGTETPSSDTENEDSATPSTGSTAPTTAAPGTAPAQNQPYTGFQSGDGSTTKSGGNTGSQSGGGWNIKY